MPKDRSSSDPLRGTEEEVRRWIGVRYGNPQDWTVEAVSEKGVGKRRRLLRAHDRSSGRSLAVKANRVPRRNREQFEALEALYRQTAECVRPLFLAEDDAFFVMEWVDAPLLEKRLGGLRRKALIRGAGEWLSRLHGATAGPEHEITRGMLPLFDERDDEAVAAVAARLDERFDRIDAPACRLTMLHGDFTPRNIFCTEDGLRVFDRQRDERGLPLLDVARFLANLAVRRRQAVWSLRPWLGDAETDRRLFFEGYGALGEETWELYEFIENLEFLNRWRARRRNRLDDRARTILEGELRRRGLLDRAASGRAPAAGGLVGRVAGRLGARRRVRSRP